MYYAFNFSIHLKFFKIKNWGKRYEDIVTNNTLSRGKALWSNTFQKNVWYFITFLYEMPWIWFNFSLDFFWKCYEPSKSQCSKVKMNIKHQDFWFYGFSEGLYWKVFLKSHTSMYMCTWKELLWSEKLKQKKLIGI